MRRACDTVDLQNVGYASFLIRGVGGPNRVTDFTGIVGLTRLIPDEVTVDDVGGPYLNVRRDALPSQPTIMVLRPTYISDD